MSNRFANFIDFLKGSIRVRLNVGSGQTADHDVTFPVNKSGVIAVAEAKAFSAAVPFNGITTFATQNVSAVITFTIAAVTKVPGSQAIYRIVSDGVNTPVFSEFRQTLHSSGYDGRNGVLNLFTFVFDGVDHWVTITQEIGALPALANIALTFPATTNRTANITQSGSDWGISGSGTVAFVGQMVAIQSAPAGKTAVLIVEVDELMLIGFNDSPSLQPYTNFEYQSWISGGNLFSNTNPSALVNHGAIAPVTNVWLKLTRNGATGVVTLHRSVSPGSTWTLVRTFGNANTGVLYPAFDLSENIGSRQLKIISFEVQP